MSNPYDLTPSEDGLSYQFTTDFGDKYTAYFTSFYLQNLQSEDVEVSSREMARQETDESLFQDGLMNCPIVSRQNPHKEKLIAAFKHTLRYWMGDQRVIDVRFTLPGTIA